MKHIALILALIFSHAVGAQQVTKPFNGGTGISQANTKTITLGGPLVTSGAFTTTITSTGTTNATLPAGTTTLLSSGGALGTPSSGTGTNITGVNAATLGGATFAAPGAIGGGTPAAGSFTSLITTDNVGVGVTPSASATGTAIQVGLNTGVGTVVGTQSIFSENVYYTGSTWKAISTNTGFAAIRMVAGAMQFHTDGSAFTAGDTLTSMDSTALKMALSTSGGLTLSALTAASGTPNSICQNNGTKEITVNAALTCAVSSARFKDSIEPFMGSGLQMVGAMQTDTFFYKDRLDRPRIGLVAEQLAAIDPRLSEWDEQGRPNSIDFPAIMGVLAKAIQEQQAQIEKLQARIDDLVGMKYVSR